MSEILLVSNPHRRKKKHRGRFRRNPSVRGVTGLVMPTLKAGFVGAGGALGNDLLWGFAGKWLPDFLKTGVMRHVTKVGTAVLVGVIGGMAFRGRGTQLAAGAATVAIHDALKEQIIANFPAIPLGDYDPDLLGYEDAAQHVGEYMNPGVGEFAQVGLGEYMQP